MRRRPCNGRPCVRPMSNGINIGGEYDAEQVAFMNAMEKEQRRLGRRLTSVDILRVAKKLGYKRD